jgi:hypothetical protein
MKRSSDIVFDELLCGAPGKGGSTVARSEIRLRFDVYVKVGLGVAVKEIDVIILSTDGNRKMSREE